MVEARSNIKDARPTSQWASARCTGNGLARTSEIPWFDPLILYKLQCVVSDRPMSFLSGYFEILLSR